MLKGKYISQQGSAKTLSVLVQTSLSASLAFWGFIHAKCSGQYSLYPGKSLLCVFHVATALSGESHINISLARFTRSWFPALPGLLISFMSDPFR